MSKDETKGDVVLGMPPDATKDQPAKGVEGDMFASHGSTNMKTFWVSIFQADDPPERIVQPSEYKLGRVASTLDNFFRITERGSTFATEASGGMTTFFSMCYIMVLNGIIIGGPFNSGIPKKGVFFATALASGIFTLMMGVLVNVPVALAPGMGLNGYFNTISKNVCWPKTGPKGEDWSTAWMAWDNEQLLDNFPKDCPGWGETSLPWTDAMGAVFISGWFYIFFTVTGLRSMLFTAVPQSLRAAITVGIGFFITIIGLKIGEITRVSVAGWALGDVGKYPDLKFEWYDLGFVNINTNPHARISVLGLAIVSGLTVLRVKSAIIITICLCTFVGINYSYPLSDGDAKTPGKSVTNLSSWFGFEAALKAAGSDEQKREISDSFFLPDLNVIPSGHLTFKYARTPMFWEAVWTFLFVEMFDSFGTLTGIMTRCGFMKGDPEKAMTRVNRAMCVDGLGLWLGGIIGANSITCFIESNTGVESGARTGFASVVTGSAFLLSLCFVAPFVAIIPDAATSCALVMVGVYSLDGVREINFDDIIDQLSAFFTIATMGFTYSIANGICAGFIFYSWMKVVRWAAQHLFLKVRPAWAYGKEVNCDPPHPMMLLMGAFMAVRFSFLGPGHQ